MRLWRPHTALGALAVLAALALARPAAAQDGPAPLDYPAPLSDTVSDYADLLPPDAEARLSERLSAIRDETGVEIAVATIERKADHGGGRQTIEGFATGWFNAWGVGDADRQDGILILVARSDREMRIVLGAGYPLADDLIARRIVETEILPAFRDGRYAEGIAAGAEAAIERLAKPRSRGDPAAARPKPGGAREAPPAEGAGTAGPAAIAAAIIAALLLWANRARLGELALRIGGRCPACGGRGLRTDRRAVSPPNGVNEGRQERIVRCAACGYERPSPRAPRHPGVGPGDAGAGLGRSGGRSGRDGGFGGGRSSGGGASGRW